MGADSSTTGAAVRATVASAVYFVTLVTVGLVIARVSTLNVLANLPGQIATLCSVVAVLFVSARAFDVSPATYGLDMNRRWVENMFGGLFIGVLFQAASTAAILATEAGTITDQWSMGVFDSSVAVAVAVGATVVAFFIIAIGEDLLFRGVLIREFEIGLTSRAVSRLGATMSAVVGSALLFGMLHLNAGAAGFSTAVAVLQAVVGGLYFGLAYILTDSLALPVGIHFSTNLWATVVFGQPDSGYPAVFRLTRSFDLGVDILVIYFLPVVVLVAAVFGWVRATRGGFPELALNTTS